MNTFANRGSCLALLVLLLAGSSARADALSDLNKEFLQAYKGGQERTLATLRASVPIIVNRFGQMALYRPGVDKPEMFSMKMAQYLEARAVAHTPAALYTRLVPFGFGRLDDARLVWLARYATLLSAAEEAVAARTDIPEAMKAVQVDMLGNVRRFAQRIQQQGSVEPETFDELAGTVKEGVRENLAFAARSQLTQFRTQVNTWKTSYPTLKWEEAVVVIVGIHQARRGYLQRQFFDWMLEDSPDAENQVVFAETLTVPAPLEKEPAYDALTLLSKVMMDKGLSSTLFDDPLKLQSDVLGDAAAEIIGSWPPF